MNRIVDRGFIVDRGRPGLHLDTRKLGLQGSTCRLQHRSVDIKQRQACVAGGKRPRHGQANTLAGAGNEHDFAGKIMKSLARSEEHTSELQSLMRISYAVFCLKKKKKQIN